MIDFAPLVSIIIPVYNVEKYLPQCLNSVITQTYSNLEVILINDGSPDNSDSICRDYANRDSRIRYIKKQNSGVPDTRNLGIKESTGIYLFFLDSDDYLNEDCIQTLVDTAENGALPITGFLLDFYDENRIRQTEQHYGLYDSIDSFLQDFRYYFATKTNFSWGKLYIRKTIIDNNLQFPIGISLGEDILFNIKYYDLFEGCVSVLNYCGYYYRQHGSTTLSKKFDHRMFEWNEFAYTEIRNFLNRHNAMTELNRCHFYGNVLSILLYSTELLCLAQKIHFSEKMRLIKHYSHTSLIDDTFRYAKRKGIRLRSESTLMRDYPALYYIYNRAVFVYRTIKRKLNENNTRHI